MTERKKITFGIESFIKERFAYYLDILKYMVDINTHTSNAGGVNRLGEYTASLFSGLGLKGEPVKSVNNNYGNHLVLSTETDSPYVIANVSHMDTVYLQEEEERYGFLWRDEGDKIFGPGTLDIKGGTVIIYMMMDALKNLQPEIYNSFNWMVLLDSSEETDSEDFGQLCLSRLKPHKSICLVFEGGEINGNKMKLVVSRKGRAVFRITTRGYGAHSGVSHQRGANAITQMADVIKAVSSLTDYKKNLTVNIGSVEGGLTPNRVPEDTVIIGEIRAFSMTTFNYAMERLIALEDMETLKSGDGKNRCSVKVEILKKVNPWEDNTDTHELYDTWEKAARKMGYTLVPEERGGLSDGNYLWHSIPVLDGLGPAGGNPHCSLWEGVENEREFIYRESLITKTVLNILGINEYYNKIFGHA